MFIEKEMEHVLFHELTAQCVKWLVYKGDPSEFGNSSANSSVTNESHLIRGIEPFTPK